MIGPKTVLDWMPPDVIKPLVAVIGVGATSTPAGLGPKLSAARFKVIRDPFTRASTMAAVARALEIPDEFPSIAENNCGIVSTVRTVTEYSTQPTRPGFVAQPGTVVPSWRVTGCVPTFGGEKVTF
jgi:hypothetical protein